MLGRRKGPPPKEVVENYKRWEKLQAEMGQTILELMGHPDTTLEQLWGVRLSYADRCESFREMRKRLRELFKDGSGYREKYPWNV